MPRQLLMQLTQPFRPGRRQQQRYLEHLQHIYKRTDLSFGKHIHKCNMMGKRIGEQYQRNISSCVLKPLSRSNIYLSILFIAFFCVPC